MAKSDRRNIQTDLSDWESVERALSRKHSRERRPSAATDLLYDVDTAIRVHEHEHRRLMDAGELVMPVESVAYGRGLWHVKWQLEREFERLTALTGRDFNAEESEGTQASISP